MNGFADSRMTRCDRGLSPQFRVGGRDGDRISSMDGGNPQMLDCSALRDAAFLGLTESTAGRAPNTRRGTADCGKTRTTGKDLGEGGSPSIAISGRMADPFDPGDRVTSRRIHPPKSQRTAGA